MMNNVANYRLEKSLENGGAVVKLIKRSGTTEEILNTLPVSKGELILGVEAKGQSLSFYLKQNSIKKLLAQNADGKILSVKNTGGFTGCYIGMYASSKGQLSNNYADFNWFHYNRLK
jgi:alpha-N-arabinofuranosidase